MFLDGLEDGKVIEILSGGTRPRLGGMSFQIPTNKLFTTLNDEPITESCIPFPSLQKLWLTQTKIQSMDLDLDLDLVRGWIG